MTNQLVFSIEGKGLKFDNVELIQPHLDELNKLEKVETIVLSGNTLGVEAAKAFAEVLKTKQHIKVLNLSDIFTGRLRSEIPPALIAICDAIVDKEHLIELNLSDNAFGPAGAEPLVNFLVNNKALQVLKLNNNGLGVSGGTFIAHALIKAAEEKAAKKLPTTLKTFIAGRNRLENGSSELLAKAFQAHPTLVEVRLPQNGIRPEGVTALVNGLSKIPSLEIFDLQDNTFTETGSKVLAAALVNWPKLRVLNVGDCLLKAKGGKVLATALAEARPAKIEEIILTYNEIDHAGAILLADSLKHFSKLKKLELNGNNFEEDSEASEKIKEALETINAADALGSLSDMEILSDEEDEDDEIDELTERISKLET
ncbi:RNI-like protein [Neoconidiobolus thromboides FSU 785]|nr:RNI-like protein [Neoconidiobolus thromboides FSU 785]